MHAIEVGQKFERTWRIISHPRFLSRHGLGNEVPFFIEAYKPQNEHDVVSHISALHQRLQTFGISTVLLPVYDILIDVLASVNRLQKVFDWEPSVPKTPDAGTRRTFLAEMEKFADPGVGKPLHSAIAERLQNQPDHQLVLMYQLGAVFPYLRTHTLLNNLHSLITDVPLIVFFPGHYVSSEQDGYYFSLFDRFRTEYYRAFQLEDYIERGQIRADIE